MSALGSFLIAAWTQIVIILSGLGALIRVIGIGVGSLFGSRGTIGSRLAVTFGSSDRQRLIFLNMRALVHQHLGENARGVAANGKLALRLNGAGGIKCLHDWPANSLGDRDRRRGKVHEDRNDWSARNDVR